ncbi:hypothetical protein WJX73_000029 [Symbiochloris irregularis]|uniref:Uncharacterized protein n=1 Tax=Symbiochloris irregularis TaxID=706552 RepID=A0AAW1PC24_9CHLO
MNLRSALVFTSAPDPEPNIEAAKAEEVEYKDGWTDIAFIALCRKAYGSLAGWQSERSWRDGPETFAGMVEVSRVLMKGKTAAQQKDAVIAGFPQVPGWFRKLFPYSNEAVSTSRNVDIFQRASV